MTSLILFPADIGLSWYYTMSGLATRVRPLFTLHMITLQTHSPATGIVYLMARRTRTHPKTMASVKAKPTVSSDSILNNTIQPTQASMYDTSVQAQASNTCHFFRIPTGISRYTERMLLHLLTATYRNPPTDLPISPTALLFLQLESRCQGKGKGILPML